MFGYMVTPGRGAPVEENSNGKWGVLYQIGMISRYRQSGNVDRKKSKTAVPRGGGQAYAYVPGGITWSGAFIPAEPGMKAREKKRGAFVFEVDAYKSIEGAPRPTRSHTRSKTHAGK